MTKKTGCITNECKCNLFPMKEEFVYKKEGIMKYLIILMAGGFLISSLGQTWTQKNPSAYPSARANPTTAYDSESDRIVLFGGSVGTTNYGDTWEYDLNTDTWTQKSPATTPPARTASAMVYDSENDRIIMFGGYGTGSLNDTWEYDLNTNTWTNLSPANPPSARRGHCMAYDRESGRIVLFAGYDGAYRNDTWEYDYSSNTWTQQSPSSNPPGGFIYDGMTYDSGSDRVIAFGGYSGPSGGFSDQTWAYDANTTTWTLMSPSSRPSARAGVQMAYDSMSDRVILFGGYRQASRYSDTWEYDFSNDTWAQQTPNPYPTARGQGVLTYDAESDRCVLFGGDGPSPGNPLSDTWEYDEPLIGVEEEKESILSKELLIAPNPFSGKTTALFTKDVVQNLESLQIFDASGRLIFKSPVTSSSITFGMNLRPGVYFVKVGDRQLTKVVKLSP